MRFEDLGLAPDVLKAVTEAGYETPTPIQEQAIPEVLRGRDVLGIAQTGTGKTASFTLPMIDRLAQGRSKARMARSLVICPTRELAAQAAENFEKYGRHHKLSMALLIGGVSFGDQDMKLMRGVDVLIATPGRLLDHFGRGKLLLTGVQILVVDEADRMLDMGFIPDIEKIFKLCPPTRQTLFFSATMPPEITRLTEQFLRDPIRIEVARPATTAETVAQNIVRMPQDNERMKRAALRKLIDDASVKNGIIFCNRKKTVDVLAKSLQKYGYNARPIHGDLAQAYRTQTLEGFRSGEIQFLIASDVAARGLDIPDVSHVFNFDVPIHADDYVHRIGRTGRAGRSGATYMLVAPVDGKHYDAILKTIGRTEIEELDLSEFLNALELPRERGAKRGTSRSRNGRSRRGSASRSEDSRSASEPESSTPEAAEAHSPAEAEAERAPEPKRERASRGKRSEAREATAPEPRGEKRPARPRRERNDDRMIAFGGDTPAFLTRPAPISKDRRTDARQDA